MSHTHQVEIQGELVTKTYVDWNRDEHLREWAALQVISAVHPDLVPSPIRLEEPEPEAAPAPAPEHGPGAEPGPASGRMRPVVVMSRLAGVPMGGCLSAEQMVGLQMALDALWSVPAEGLESIDLGGFVVRVRQAVSSWDGEGIIAEAHAAAGEWLVGSAVDELVEPRDVVIGHGDPNLANYLWDGERVRIVDFEDAGRADLAVELANLVEHLASRGPTGEAFSLNTRLMPSGY